MDLATAVRRQIAFVVEIDPVGIEDDNWLLEFGLDSLRMLDLAMALESEFGIELRDEEVATLVTVKDLVALISAKVGSRRSNRA